MTKRSKPFWVYVKLYQELSQKNGRQISLEEAKKEATALWSEIDEKEKELYHDLARKETIRRRLKSWICQEWSPNKPYSPDLRKAMFRYVRKVTDVAERSPQGLFNYEFFFVDVNLQSNEPELNTGTDQAIEYRPCELSVVSCSIQKGVHGTHHVHLHPGNLSTEKVPEASRLSSETHGIPIGGLPQSIRSMIAVRYRLRQFARDCAFFAPSRSLQRVSGSLRYMNKHCKRSEPIVVLDANVLLSTLLNLNVSPRRRKAMTDIDEILENEEYHDHRYLACKYHKDIGRESQCSLLRASALAYRFVQSVAKQYDVELIEGQHCLPKTPRTLEQQIKQGLETKKKLTRSCSDSHLYLSETNRVLEHRSRSQSENDMVSLNKDHLDLQSGFDDSLFIKIGELSLTSSNMSSQSLVEHCFEML